MPSKTIDIHPHIIADDEKRYPLAPLGGHQSDWSRLRPVTVDQMIAAMDEAGVDKSAIVQAAMTTPMWRMRWRPTRTASPRCFRSMCWRPMRRSGCAIGTAVGSPACGSSPSAAP
jgi:hypothetical protein